MDERFSRLDIIGRDVVGLNIERSPNEEQSYSTKLFLLSPIELGEEPIFDFDLNQYFKTQNPIRIAIQNEFGILPYRMLGTSYFGNIHTISKAINPIYPPCSSKTESHVCLRDTGKPVDIVRALLDRVHLPPIRQDQVDRLAAFIRETIKPKTQD